MESVPRALHFFPRRRPKPLSRHQIVKHGPDSPDAEGKNQALYVEPRPLCEIEQARRAPVLRNEQRLREAERGGEETRFDHGRAMAWKRGVSHEPGYEESARPKKPDILLRNHCFSVASLV